MQKYKKYKWVASATTRYPTTIRIHEHEWWFKIGKNKMESQLGRRILPHETIHNIIWTEFGEREPNGYDIIVRKFQKKTKKECPVTYNDLETY